MASLELSVRKSEPEQLLELGAQSIDLTMIYNRHAYSTDAQESVSYVEPDSFVFIEGYVTDKEAEPTFEHWLRVLNSLRFEKGKTDPDYMLLKQILLTDIQTKKYWPAQHHNDFTLQGQTELELLLQKDCIISYADYTPVQNGGEFQSAFDEYHAKFTKAAEGMGSQFLPEIEPHQGLWRVLRDYKQNLANRLVTHHSREDIGVNRLLTQMGLVAMSEQPPTDINMTQDGKFKTYVIYGSAHARSLTEKITERGINPSIINLYPLEEWQYIDTDPSNKYRRLGHNALRSLSHDFLEEKDADDIIAEGYESLAFLNDVDKEEWLAFMLQCLQIKRAENQDWEGSYRQYLSLLRSFMPEPKKYIA